MQLKSKYQETIVISVGGSLIVPNGGIDTTFLKRFNKFIRIHVKKNRRFFIVVGGGSTGRQYIKAGAKVIGQVTQEDLDWIGIHSTRLNAHLLRTIFQDIAHPRIIENYEKPLSDCKESVIIAAGWKPGWSTDYDAVVLAKDYKATVLINLSNIDYVYTRDPNKYSNAKPITRVTWDYFESIVGNKWSPGINAPFDPIAAQLAKTLKLTVIVANGNKIKNLANILNGESFIGTVITPYKVSASYYDREYFEGNKKVYRLGYTDSYIGNIIQHIVSIYRALWISLIFKPKNCLDIGCGTGLLVKYLRKLNIEAYGIEISQYALNQAEKQIRPFLKNGDIIKIPYPDNHFDLVITFDVMEHVERSKLKQSMLESVRVSRKWIVHKIFTTENMWMYLLHKKDFSHVSILSNHYWINLIKYISNVMLVRKLYYKLPSFIESIFVLRKKM